MDCFLPNHKEPSALSTALKVCCIASAEEARLAVEAGASALGLVSAMPSGPGVIAESLIAEVAASVPPGIETFLLTSRIEGDAIAEQLEACRPTTVQLVDAVPDSAYATLRRRCPAVKIVQVVHVTGPESLAEAERASARADALLLDSGRPDQTVKELGGTGRTHDWSLSRDIVAAVAKPVYLAGGIRPDNVRAAIDAVRPYGIDLCTGVRSEGRLDPVKLERLVAAMRAA